MLRRVALFLRSVLRLVVTAKVFPMLPILVTHMMRRYVPPNSRFLQVPHGLTFQKTAFFTQEFLPQGSLLEA
jgi:hypothetical protein